MSSLTGHWTLRFDLSRSGDNVRMLLGLRLYAAYEERKRAGRKEGVGPAEAFRLLSNSPDQCRISAHDRAAPALRWSCPTYRHIRIKLAATSLNGKKSCAA